jgi:DNA transposition AAA+ family ATPase
MDENDKSQAYVAKSLALSGTVLSQYLGGKYPGDNEGIDKQVKAFLDLQQARAERKKIVTPFLETSVARKVHEAASIAHEDGIMVVVVSEAGYGKTEALKEYAKRNPDVIYLEIDLGYNAQVLFQEIHKHEFGDTSHKELHDMHNSIIDKLRGSGRMIIIDQAEYLPHKALEMLRAVYDSAGVGILLCGLPRLLENLRGQRGQYLQLHSRIGAVAKLAPITMDDAKLIITRMLGEKRAEKVYASFYKRANCNARHMVKMVNAAVRIAHVNQCHINEDVVAGAEEMVRV